jgi:hypothetical protein
VTTGLPHAAALGVLLGIDAVAFGLAVLVEQVTLVIAGRHFTSAMK